MSPPPAKPSADKGPLGFIKDLALGGSAGVFAKTLCAPLERVKIVLQTGAATAADGSKPSMLGTGKMIVQNQGVAGLWRGNFTNCIRYFPTQAMNFAFKEKYQKLFIKPKEEVGFARWFMGYLAAGGAAGATSLTVVYPLEFSYTRLAADAGKGAEREFQGGLVDVVKTIAKKDGFMGLYRGFGPSVAGIIVYRAGYFGFYDVGKQLAFGDNQADANIFLKFLIALNVDIAAAMFAYPLDTVRRRLMMQSGKAASEMEFTTAIGAFRHILAKEGAIGFYKGCFANNVRAIASALVLVVYDELKKFFG